MIRDRMQRAFLRDPDAIQANLRALHDAGLIDDIPTLFQVSMGVAHMWHRILFRPDTIGVAPDVPVRDTWRARVMERRWARFPFLVRERVIHPFELTGLATSTAALRAHVMGAFHPGEQALYDFAILAAWPGELEALRDELQSLVDGTHPRGAWLADLCVYENYHQHALALVEGALQGRFESDSDREADTTLRGFVRFLCTQPETATAALRALREGRLRVSAH